MRRGRPPKVQQRDVPSSLIEAAFLALKTKSHIELKLTDVAQIAGTQPSMIRYYFGDKDGLLFALSEIMIRRAEQEIITIESSIRLSPRPVSLLIRALANVYYASPYFEAGRTMMIEALRPGSELINLYRSRRAMKTFLRVLRVIREAVANGLYRADLDIELAAMSVISLVGGPVTCLSMFRLGSDIESFDHDAWLHHASNMLERDFAAR